MNWTDPVAIDNSGVAPTVTSNYQSPQRFNQGVHVIKYRAMDQSGNEARCSFQVSVTGTKADLHGFDWFKTNLKVQAVRVGTTTAINFEINGKANTAFLERPILIFRLFSL